MFDERWVTLFVFIASIGVLMRIPALTALGVIGLVITAATSLLQRRALRGVVYERRFNETRLFVGETLTISNHVTNRGRLPVLSLQIDDRAPKRSSWCRAPPPSPRTRPTAAATMRW